MKNHEIENWALSAIDRMKAAQPVEDSRVELKAAWPEAPKAARRIAAHANAARGDLILWLIGVDESGRAVTGASHTEMADWWPQVRAQFDGLAPSVIDLSVPVDGMTVVALVFKTDRAPYVVKTQNAGAVTLEVPWRGSTQVRSARRGELLRILSQLQALPDIEILSGGFRQEGQYRAQSGLTWVLRLQLYIVPQTTPLTIPFHKCTGSIRIEGTAAEDDLQAIELGAPSSIAPGKFKSSPSETINFSDYEATLSGPGVVELEASSKFTEDTSGGTPNKLQVTLTLLSADAERPVVLTEKLIPVETKTGRAWLIER